MECGNRNRNERSVVSSLPGSLQGCQRILSDVKIFEFAQSRVQYLNVSLGFYYFPLHPKKNYSVTNFSYDDV